MCTCSVAKSCPILCDPMGYSLPDSSVYGISQAKNTEVGCHFLLHKLISLLQDFSEPWYTCTFHKSPRKRQVYNIWKIYWPTELCLNIIPHLDSNTFWEILVNCYPLPRKKNYSSKIWKISPLKWEIRLQRVLRVKKYFHTLLGAGMY